jgi:putative N6-adenine-specific DNA methylase
VLASGWKSTEPLIDPMCGSGTIPIEAALLARGIAPGLRRKFAFMDWPTFEPRRWQENLARAEALITEKPRLEIIGSDRDTGAVEASRNNAERGGVEGDIQFSERPLSDTVGILDDFGRPGWILTNPPYGVRLGDTAGLANLYGKLGSALKSADGWRLGILTSDTTLARQTGLPLRARFSTRNGGIPVAFFGQERA